MTREDMLEVLAVVAIKWPHSDLGDPQMAVAGWMHELARFDRAEVEAAIDRLSAREFAPTAGIVAQEVMIGRHGPPPGFDEMQAFLSRHVRLLPYRQGNRPQDTPAAVAALEAAGAHEAVLRFVAAHGVHAVRHMPDPTLQPLDPNRQADRRDMNRDYAQRVVPEWRQDPRPGLALERACRPVGIDPAEAREIAAAERRRELERAQEQRRALPAAEEDEGPFVDVSPGDLLEVWRRSMAEARAEQRAAAAAARERENTERLAAERELAELRRRREETAS